MEPFLTVKHLDASYNTINCYGPANILNIKRDDIPNTASFAINNNRNGGTTNVSIKKSENPNCIKNIPNEIALNAGFS